VAFLVDTTESVHAAEREEAQREQLVHADRMASLGVLLAGMAHEINNPNNLAMFNAELLERIVTEVEPVLDAHHVLHPDFALSGIPYQEMKPEVHALLEGIRGSTLRIRDIISGLKDFSRRNPVSDHRPVDLSQVARSSLLLVGNLVRKSTDRFETDMEEDLPKVDGDPQRLEQVVVNLLTNACQALPARDRLLRVRTRMSDSGTVELEVEDEGVGIAAENLPKILDPFFTTKREEGGTGLGLAVSWGIVQAHRGQLTFLPREGGGTRAILRIPVSKTEVNG
jgi:polar amino acid transport system substrate-binding protein